MTPSHGQPFRADIEDEFATVLAGLTPTKTLFTMIKAMFEDAWDQQRRCVAHAATSMKKDLKDIDAKID
ncbi:MAG: hypothetical protein AAGF86_19730 [Pseudomonadota bacterium]